MNFDLSLDGEWNLSSPELPKQHFPMAVPGDNYSALLAAEAIPDPYWGCNEKLVQRYAGMTWKMEREFSVSEDMLRHEQILLELEKVDTLAEFRVNGRKVLMTDNMFRRYRLAVKKFLHPGANRIEVIFRPVIPEAAARNARLPFPVPMTSCCPTPHLNLIRKTICHVCAH